MWGYESCIQSKLKLYNICSCDCTYFNYKQREYILLRRDHKIRKSNGDAAKTPGKLMT